jgi:hypothetical protein
MVSAFGRGATLVPALRELGFTVRVLDFTSAFPPEYRRGTGPFPLAIKGFLPEQEAWLHEVKTLERGLTFWLADGPIELAGPMAEFFRARRPEVAALTGGPVTGFNDDWLRRFLAQWASPFHDEAWRTSGGRQSSFVVTEPIGLIPFHQEARALEFDDDAVSCLSLQDIRFEGSRLMEAVVDVGQPLAVAAPQWVWCLSSRETEMLNPDLAPRIFNRGVWRPEWAWASFRMSSEHGPWSDGFPAYSVVLGDVFLPWVYANALVLRRLDPDEFQVWMKVPAAALADESARKEWADQTVALLNGRLAMAKFAVDPATWSVCPHSPVFASERRGGGRPGWKNWDWIAPETLPRLDFSARLEAEAKALRRLAQWRDDQLKKKESSRDPALHAP